MRRTRQTITPGGGLCRVALALLVFVLMALVGAQSPAAAQEQGGSCDNLLVLVDRENRLPPDYVPPDLWYLSYFRVPDLGEGELLRQEAAVNLSQMVSDASYYGIELVAADGWRSYQTQQQLYSYWESIYGPGAGRVSAPPGSSMHQLGTTVDFTNAYAGYGLNYYFGYSDAYDWLLNNARYYGYVLTYPPGYDWQTGFAWEPWQWRYVGVENAIDIVNSGMTLQGYLEQNGVRPDC